MRDARQVDEMLEAESRAPDAPIRTWYGLEVVSYYLVGFVTCLEWHVRTRLADLYTYQPDAIDKDALQGKVSAETLSQMIREDVSIAHLLSASTTVSSVRDYFAGLQQVLDALGITRTASKIVPARPPMPTLFGPPIEPPTAYQVLEELFTARHGLVHEIGLGGGASPLESNNWDVRRIRQTGSVVLELIRSFEALLTAEAPRDFPNLLDDRGRPVDQLARLRRDVATATERIQTRIEVVAEPWADELREAWGRMSESQDAVQYFVSANRLLRSRSHDQAPALAELDLQQRLKLLVALEAAMSAAT